MTCTLSEDRKTKRRDISSMVLVPSCFSLAAGKEGGGGGGGGVRWRIYINDARFDCNLTSKQEAYLSYDDNL